MPPSFGFSRSPERARNSDQLQEAKEFSAGRTRGKRRAKGPPWNRSRSLSQLSRSRGERPDCWDTVLALGMINVGLDVIQRCKDDPSQCEV